MCDQAAAAPSVTQLAEAGQRFRALADAAQQPGERPRLLLQTIVTPEAGEDLEEDTLIQMLVPAWRGVMAERQHAPHLLDPENWRIVQQLITAIYARDGWETSRVDRELLMSRPGLGSVRFIDRFTAWPSEHPLGAAEIQALLRVLPAMPAGSVGVVSSSGVYAPELPDAAAVQPFLPTRLKLRGRDDLLTWFKSAAARIHDAEGCGP